MGNEQIHALCELVANILDIVAFLLVAPEVVRLARGLVPMVALGAATLLAIVLSGVTAFTLVVYAGDERNTAVIWLFAFFVFEIGFVSLVGRHLAQIQRGAFYVGLLLFLIA